MLLLCYYKSVHNNLYMHQCALASESLIFFIIYNMDREKVKCCLCNNIFIASTSMVFTLKISNPSTLTLISIGIL